MSYKTYDKLQEVDNTFFKQIPEHWNIFKLKYIINSLESGKRKDFESEDYAFSLGGEHINWDGTLNLKNKRYISKDFYNSMSKGKIQENDTLLVKDGATIGKTAFVNNLTQKMAVNEHVFIIRNNHLLIPNLLYYLIASNLGFAQIKLTETGSAQGGISQDILDKVRFAIPNSLQEQQQIVNYLDKKTAKIDATIAKNEELIQLLEEKRVALINQVVTKGLNPNVPIKDSGVEWIGEIPEHWDKTKIRFLGTLQNGISKSSEYFGHGYPFISYGDVYNNDEIPDVINGKAKTTISERIAYSVQKNDIFCTRTSETIDEVGITSLCTKTIENGTFSGFLIRFRLFKNIDINVNFLKFYLQSIAIRHYFAKMMIIVTRASLGQNLLNNLNILLPPMEEQIQIADYLDKETSIIDKTIEKIKVNINLLEEYKTSLIHHVVTGKIDVRGEKI